MIYQLPALVAVIGPYINVMVNNFHRLRYVVAVCCVALAACGAGENSIESSQQPSDAQGGIEQIPSEQYASVAKPMLAPPASQTPVLTHVPPAPPEGPPPVASSVQRQATTRTATTPPVMRQVVESGLKDPSDIAVTGDGVIFFASGSQGVFIKRRNEASTRVFFPPDLATTAGGVLGLALDPDFGLNHFLYVFFTSSLGGREHSRVARLKFAPSYKEAIDRTDIVTGIEIAPISGAPRSNERLHRGGSLRFGPDGFLYIATAAAYSSAAQGPSALAGKVLRVDREGRAAQPHRIQGFDSRVFAYGFRAPGALGFHPYSEAVIVAERHESSPDEVLLTSFGTTPTGATVVWRSTRENEGLSSLERLRGAAWKDWRNAIAVAFDAGQRVDIVKVSRAGQIQSAPLLSRLGVGFAAVAEGPDGLYVLTRGKSGGDEIWRVWML